jgi:hypothetical protein
VRWAFCRGVCAITNLNNHLAQTIVPFALSRAGIGRAPGQETRRRSSRSPETAATATLVMRIVIVIGVIFIFLEIDQTAPRWLSHINLLPSASIAGEYHFRILLRRCSVTFFDEPR